MVTIAPISKKGKPTPLISFFMHSTNIQLTGTIYKLSVTVDINLNLTYVLNSRRFKFCRGYMQVTSWLATRVRVKSESKKSKEKGHSRALRVDEERHNSDTSWGLGKGLAKYERIKGRRRTFHAK